MSRRVSEFQGKPINQIFFMKTDGFHGELFHPAQDAYPGKVLICFTGSDGKFELARKLAAVFRSHGLTALALAYVMEAGLPDCFYHVPIDPLEAAAKRLHEMGYEKVGLWGISKGAELALTAGSLMPGLVNAVVAVAPVSTVCQGFTKKKGIRLLPNVILLSSPWPLLLTRNAKNKAPPSLAENGEGSLISNVFLNFEFSLDKFVFVLL